MYYYKITNTDGVRGGESHDVYPTARAAALAAMSLLRAISTSHPAEWARGFYCHVEIKKVTDGSIHMVYPHGVVERPATDKVVTEFSGTSHKILGKIFRWIQTGVDVA